MDKRIPDITERGEQKCEDWFFDHNGVRVMLDDTKRAEFDQSRAVLVEILPPLWKGLYDGLLRAGFDEKEAMTLLCEYIATSCSSIQ